MTNPSVSQSRIEALKNMAQRLRRHSLLSTAASRSGHPSTCFSCAEIVSTIFFYQLRYDLKEPKNPSNDRFVLSKGHAAPILWAALAEGGAFPVEELMNLRKIDSVLEGHPTPRSEFVDVATGSLGQGLSNAVGMAFASRLDGVRNRIYVLMGDGETAEGAVWEAAAIASHYHLNNLVAIVDCNRLGQSEATMYGHDLESYARKFEAFGWDVQVIDGHRIGEIAEALNRAVEDGPRPHAIIARTLKGKGVSFMEDANGWHGKPVTDEQMLEQALTELGPIRPLEEELRIAVPDQCAPPRPVVGSVADPDYTPGDQVATRVAYGNGLAKLGEADPSVVVLDGDCKNSTFSDTFRKAFPDRFFECYIAEQNMVGAAAGLAALGKNVFASSFACFLSRACDFIRMAGISQVNLKLCGSHAGISIGEDGPSQMALEDLAMMRAVAGSTVLYPCDGVSAEKLVAQSAKTPGIVYIRTSRPKTPVIYPNGEEFSIGGSKTIRTGDKDQAAVLAAGVTLHEALKAYDELKKEGISIRVIDLYSIKPIDAETINRAARETRNLVTVEDHYPEGGIGEAVRSALTESGYNLKILAVGGLPRSGKPEELLDRFGINAAAIVRAVKSML